MYETFDLSHTECEQLLRAGLVGRVAACTPDGPHIIPVNYAVTDDAIVLRTTPYSLLGSHAKGSVPVHALIRIVVGLVPVTWPRSAKPVR